MHLGRDVLRTRDQVTLGSRTSDSSSRTLGGISDRYTSVGVAGISSLWGFVRSLVYHAFRVTHTHSPFSF